MFYSAFFDGNIEAIKSVSQVEKLLVTCMGKMKT